MGKDISKHHFYSESKVSIFQAQTILEKKKVYKMIFKSDLYPLIFYFQLQPFSYCQRIIQ